MHRKKKSKCDKKVKKELFITHKIQKEMKRRQNKNKKHRRHKNNNTNNLKNENNICYSKIIDFLEKSNFKKKVRRKQKEVSINIDIPRVFNFIKNPNETILTLKKIFYAGMNKNIKEINLNHSKCVDLGLCASLLTDLIVIELKNKRCNKLNFKGHTPVSQEACKLFYITGLIKHLGISNAESADTRTLDIISNMDVSKMSEKIVDFYQECLKTQGYALSDLGENAFFQMIGEVIDNAKQYSGEYGTWHAQGYFDKPEENKLYGKCRLVLMNFGTSIYECLKQTDTTEFTKKQLKNQTDKVKRFFDILYNEETLWTLYALQKNVSKKREKEGKNSDRGKGTIDLIQNFTMIGDNTNEEKPIMSITSGGCHILFDGTYKLKEYKYKNGKTMPIIAFNEKNSLNKKPDKNNVYTIANKFPGTVISMEFYLDRKYINEILNKGDS